MATASKEANRYQSVEDMLNLLISDPSKLFTRRKLFGTKYQSWQARLLSELCETGIIKRGGPENRPNYCAVNTTGLSEIVEDEIAISGLAWPSQRQLVAEEDQNTEDPPASIEPIDEKEENDPDPQQVAQITLKLLAAFIENFAWLREKVEKMDTELVSLRADVKEWKSLWE